MKISELQSYVWQTMEEKGFHVANEDTERMETMARISFVYNQITSVVQCVKRTWANSPTYDQRLDCQAKLGGYATRELIGNGFHTFPDPEHVGILARLSLIHTEVSEAAEVAGDKEKLGEEIADIVIRCLDLCGTENIDLETAIMTKMEKNAARPFRYGTPDALKSRPDGTGMFTVPNPEADAYRAHLDNPSVDYRSVVVAAREADQAEIAARIQARAKDAAQNQRGQG